MEESVFSTLHESYNHIALSLEPLYIWWGRIWIPAIITCWFGFHSGITFGPTVKHKVDVNSHLTSMMTFPIQRKLIYCLSMNIIFLVFHFTTDPPLEPTGRPRKLCPGGYYSVSLSDTFNGNLFTSLPWTPTSAWATSLRIPHRTYSTTKKDFRIIVQVVIILLVWVIRSGEIVTELFTN